MSLMPRFGLALGSGVLFILSGSALGAPPSTRPANRPSARSRPVVARPAKRVTARRAPASRPTRRKPKVVKRRCPEGRRYGNYCLGRLIGPKVKVRRLRCPHDGEVVEVLAISNLRSKGMDSDLRPHITRFGQREYIWMCPRSHYAAFPKDFFKPYDRLLMERALRSVRRPLPPGEPIPAGVRFLAAEASYVARRKGVKFFGQFYLRASWAAREEKNARLARTFRSKANSAMRLGLRKRVYPLSKRPTIAYLIGELYRLNSSFYRANIWYERAWKFVDIANKKLKRKASGLKRLIVKARRLAAKKNNKVFVLPGSRKLSPIDLPKKRKTPKKP